MDKREAVELLRARLAELRALDYSELQAYLTPETAAIKGSSGTLYQLETQAFWDSGRPGTNLRILASIDDGGIRAFYPLSDDFIISPDGSFVGE